MKVIKHLVPLLCALQLAGCGDDDVSESTYTPPTDYTFSSRTNDVFDSSVSNEVAITQELMIQEIIRFINSDELQEVSTTVEADRRFEIAFSKGTVTTGISLIGSLTNTDIYSGVTGLPLTISLFPDQELPTLQQNYTQLSESVNLVDALVGTDRKLPFESTIEEVIDDVSEEVIVGNLIGMELLAGVTDGNEMVKELFEAWFVFLGINAVDGVSATGAIAENGVHYDQLMESLLRGAINYSKITQFNIDPTLGVLAQNEEPVNAEEVADQELQVRIAELRLEQTEDDIEAGEKELEKLLDEWLVLDPNADVTASLSDYQTDYEFETAAELYFDQAGKLISLGNRKNTYISDLAARESEVDELLPYTLLAKNWDEALGYFGAARDYGDRLDSEIISNPEYDTNGDGEIDLYSEMNFGFAIDAVQRDAGAVLANTDFSRTIWDAFIMGRHIIQQNFGRVAKENVGYHNDLKIQADIILDHIEKLLVANIIHKLNLIISNITAAYSDNDPAELQDLTHPYYANWSSLKGMVVSLQFNNAPSITQAEMENIHELIGGEEPIPSNNNFLRVKTDMESARTILQQVYGFDAANVEAW